MLPGEIGKEYGDRPADSERDEKVDEHFLHGTLFLLPAAFDEKTGIVYAHYPRYPTSLNELLIGAP
jgi:hypothetical protein